MINKNDISKEHIDKAYDMVKEYCDGKNISVMDFVNNEQNIPMAAKEIHGKLNFVMKMAMRPAMIESLIKDNIDFIRAEAAKRV